MSGDEAEDGQREQGMAWGSGEGGHGRRATGQVRRGSRPGTSEARPGAARVQQDGAAEGSPVRGEAVCRAAAVGFRHDGVGVLRHLTRRGKGGEGGAHRGGDDEMGSSGGDGERRKKKCSGLLS